MPMIISMPCSSGCVILVIDKTSMAKGAVNFVTMHALFVIIHLLSKMVLTDVSQIFIYRELALPFTKLLCP